MTAMNTSSGGPKSLFVLSSLICDASDLLFGCPEVVDSISGLPSTCPECVDRLMGLKLLPPDKETRHLSILLRLHISLLNSWLEGLQCVPLETRPHILDFDFESREPVRNICSLVKS